MDFEYATIAELQTLLGNRLQAMRIDRRLTQEEAAAKGGLSLRALQQLEGGKGSTVETFLRALKALGSIDALDTLAPQPTISPLAMLKSRKAPTRVRHTRSDR